MTTTSQEDEIDPIATERRLIFEHTEGLETQLRMAVVDIRGDDKPLPKKVWTDLLQDIFEPYIQQRIATATNRAKLVSQIAILRLVLEHGSKDGLSIEKIISKLEAQLSKQEEVE